VWSIGHHIKEALKANNVATGSAAHTRAVELMEEAGLTDAERRINQYPHQFSGGQRQRALIACGLAARPRLLIADEPTSALDREAATAFLQLMAAQCAAAGTTAVVVSHDDSLQPLFDRVVQLQDINHAGAAHV